MSDTVPIAETVELDLSGRQIGDYRILRRLGRGGMADVYLAEQTSLRRQVALKLLKRELSTDETYVRRFHLEAQAAAALVHANIVQIYEVGRVDGHHYIAQEYVQGCNLKEYMTRRGLPEPKLALSILRQVAAALARAGDQGVVHRDIKPENIMLTKDGEVKVADFGLARVASNGNALNLTQVGVTMGTPLYMSPEQVEGKSFDARSDLYSLGVTSYHMLTGEPPFRGDTALAVAIQHVRSEPPRLETLRPDLPPALCRVVHKLMAKLPEQRYQSPREVLRELRSIQAPGDTDRGESGEDWSPGELAALGETPIALTQELDGLMKTQALLAVNNRWQRYAAAVVLGASLFGATVGLATRESFLLDDQQAPAEIPALDSAKAQVQYALFYGTGSNPEAWKTVVDRFAKSPKPDDQIWVVHALQTLAILHLQKNEWAEALPYFEQLEDMPVRESNARARGLAGQVVVYAILKKPQMGEKLAELTEVAKNRLPELVGQDMTSQIKRIIEDQRENMGPEAQQQMDLLLDHLTGDSSGNNVRSRNTPRQPVDNTSQRRNT
jgi:serine/threonine-protein kinase